MKELREIWNIMKYLFSHTPRHQQDTIRFSSQAQREGGNYLEEIYEISEIYGIQEIYQVCEKRDFFAWFLVGRHWGSGRAEDHAFCFFKKVRNSQIFYSHEAPTYMLSALCCVICAACIFAFVAMIHRFSHF